MNLKNYLTKKIMREEIDYLIIKSCKGNLPDELKKILDNFSKYFNKRDIKDLYFSLVLSVVSVWNELDFSTINVFIFELSSKLFCLFSSKPDSVLLILEKNQA